ncbi:MAG TPA: hypothetical protein P5567_12900 [Kiritimatiellia bacterium]|nr:hypothetical protein [Kiritimatiellia bacterium]HRZ13340.1 hypothetical protein [Kiritimatiellia bacterium]HSA18789.1 hypothetical protein [Kiritimatiellia bacterium]
MAWTFATAFGGHILGFFRLGSKQPPSPYITPPDSVLAKGEVGYDGQMFLTVALDPLLANPGTRAALDNPRYRYRRILFPVLGYALSLGQRALIPWMLVLINGVCFVSVTMVTARLLESLGQPARAALFALGIPGFWCALLLTTSELLAGLLFALALFCYGRERHGWTAVFFGLAGLTHETMLIVIGTLAFPLAGQRKWRAAGILALGSLPAVLWNLFILWKLPPAGSTTGLVASFSWPGAGIAQKVLTIARGPFSAKGLFDSATFLLLAVTFGLLVIAFLQERRSRFILPCALAYLGFFTLSKMHLIAYYIDFLRVFSNAVFLLIPALAWGAGRRATSTLLLAWSACSAALVAAYSAGLI